MSWTQCQLTTVGYCSPGTVYTTFKVSMYPWQTVIKTRLSTSTFIAVINKLIQKLQLQYNKLMKHHHSRKKRHAEDWQMKLSLEWHHWTVHYSSYAGSLGSGFQLPVNLRATTTCHTLFANKMHGMGSPSGSDTLVSKSRFHLTVL